jgi:hypothetical protein
MTDWPSDHVCRILAVVKRAEQNLAGLSAADVVADTAHTGAAARLNDAVNESGAVWTAMGMDPFRRPDAAMDVACESVADYDGVARERLMGASAAREAYSVLLRASSDASEKTPDLAAIDAGLTSARQWLANSDQGMSGGLAAVRRFEDLSSDAMEAVHGPHEPVSLDDLLAPRLGDGGR